MIEPDGQLESTQSGPLWDVVSPFVDDERVVAQEDIQEVRLLGDGDNSFRNFGRRGRTGGAVRISDD